MDKLKGILERNPNIGLDEDTIAVANSSFSNQTKRISLRVYYKDSYEEGKRVSPVCWSNDSKKPDVEVRKPQAKSCHTCPSSVRGSGSGGVGTSCRLSWRVAIVLANDPEGDILELVLPSNSCFGKEEQSKWPFKTYIQMLAEAAEDWVLEAIKDQAENQAAHNAIKLTVYQVDDAEDREPVKFEAFEASDEEKAKVKTAKEADDVNKIMNKWRK